MCHIPNPLTCWKTVFSKLIYFDKPITKHDSWGYWNVPRDDINKRDICFTMFWSHSSPFNRSFVPPTRDEESETQRKAHAKRVRETRRSTQGVTLDEIKSAEQLVKMKNANNNGNVSLKRVLRIPIKLFFRVKIFRWYESMLRLGLYHHLPPLNLTKQTLLIAKRKTKKLEKPENFQSDGESEWA